MFLHCDMNEGDEMDNDFLIECMENEIENSCFDFKKDIYDFDNPENKTAFLVDILSFANSHISGDKYIITGIKINKDNSRNYVGITEAKIKDGADYQSLIDDNIEPNIVIDFKVIEYENNKYGIFKINKENVDKPYMLSKKYNNLNKGFIKIRKGQKNEFISRRDLDLFYKEKNKKEFSDIHLKGIINDKACDSFEINRFSFEFDESKISEAANKIFEQIFKIKLEKSSPDLKIGNQIYVDEHYIECIKLYAKKNSINLPNDFFDFGNLTYLSIGMAGTTYYGSASEKQKYQLVSMLGQDISKIMDLDNYYRQIEKICYTELVIQNLGKKFDEDIEVVLKIEKNKLLNFINFPVPAEIIIEDILDKNLLDSFLQNSKINGINDYVGKIPRIPPIYPNSLKLPVGYSKPGYDAFVEYYKECIQIIADYEINSDDKYYYIKYNQKEIKPNELIYLPSRILFVKEPNTIEYEIRTKHNPNIINGKIILKED